MVNGRSLAESEPMPTKPKDPLQTGVMNNGHKKAQKAQKH